MSETNRNLKNAGKTIRPLPSAVNESLDDGTSILMNLDTKYYFQLNPTGSRMWQYIEKHKKLKVQQLFDAMCEIYDIENNVIADDINEFLQILNKEKMIEMA